MQNRKEVATLDWKGSHLETNRPVKIFKVQANLPQ